MVLQNDEKFCPFCSEVIKAQAIRCKHCRSDLNGSSSPEGTYSTSGGAYGFAIGGSGHHIDGGLHITNTLSELDEIDPTKKKALLLAYEEQVRNFPESAQIHFALGLSYLDLRLYEQAARSLTQALGRGSQEANLYFYLALACLGGKQPKTLPLPRIKEIESYLEAALHSEESSEAALLWSVIKYDYYLSNGLRVKPPSIEDLLLTLQKKSISIHQLEALGKHIKIPTAIDNTIRGHQRPQSTQSEEAP